MRIPIHKVDCDVACLDDQAGNVDGHHQNEVGHLFGAIQRPDEAVQQCGDIRNTRVLPRLFPLDDRPECRPAIGENPKPF